MPELAFQCPYCRSDLQIPDNVWYYTCLHCREQLDLKAQFAFARGLDAFDEGQKLMIDRGPTRPRNKIRYNETYADILHLFTEAYSALQVAFAGRLEEVQRQVGIEMMASMSTEFMLQNMVSPFEMNYWNLTLTELRAQTEINQIKQTLSEGNIGVIKRLRGRIRLNQLRGKLPEVSRKLAFLEEQIAFVEPPRARNKNWKP